MNGLFKKLANGGPFSLPFLLYMYNGTRDVCLVNSSDSVFFNEREFLPSTFKYLPNPNGEASLEIELVENGNEIINIFEEDYEFNTKIVGVIMEDGNVQEISSYFHHYGTATWNGKSGTVTFTKDDRFQMTFPALIFNHYNNRGNN